MRVYLLWTKFAAVPLLLLTSSSAFAMGALSKKFLLAVTLLTQAFTGVVGGGVFNPTLANGCQNRDRWITCENIDQCEDTARGCANYVEYLCEENRDHILDFVDQFSKNDVDIINGFYQRAQEEIEVAEFRNLTLDYDPIFQAELYTQEYLLEKLGYHFASTVGGCESRGFSKGIEGGLNGASTLEPAYGLIALILMAQYSASYFDFAFSNSGKKIQEAYAEIKDQID